MVSVVPNFTLTNQEGSKINFYDALDNTNKGMVIFVYPKANTPGCTKQACGFRDNYTEIKDSGYEVVGLSKDKQSAQASWKKSKNLPYDLLSDEDGEILKQLGCLSGTSTIRSVFIVDKETRSMVLDRVKISPEESVTAVVKKVKGVSDSEDSESSADVDKEEEEEEVKESKPSAKGKAKAKAKKQAGRGRPPVDKKVSTDEDETEVVVEKKGPGSKRVVAKRSDSVDVAANEKKRPPRGTPPAITTTTTTTTPLKKSVKRKEPSGGAEGPDGSPKGQKRSKKTTSSTDEDSAGGDGAPAVPQPTSQPKTGRVTRKAVEKAAASLAAESQPEQVKAKAKRGANAAPRSSSTTASKRGKK